MRSLIVSDIHGNLEALRSVIDHADDNGGFDQIWQLGDIVGYGPEPGGCIDLLLQYDHVGVAGNHDLAAVEKIGLELFNDSAAEAARWTMTQLSPGHVDYLRGLSLKLEVGDFTFAHGSPRDPVWEYLVTEDSAKPNFAYFSTTRCLVGHSHLPFLCKQEGEAAVFYSFPVRLPVRLQADRYIINPGSVGQPRDGLPTASYALYDSVSRTIVHQRTRYDVAATQGKMRDCCLPTYLVERLAIGR
jgi:diadenosine tetraphosphatase ApaH/serine/threonine PP2A family protein phosphatase